MTPDCQVLPRQQLPALSWPNKRVKETQGGPCFRVGQVVHPIAQSFAADHHGTVYAAGQDPAHHLGVFRMDGTVEFIAPRSYSLTGMLAAIGGSGDLVVGSAGDTLHVFDSVVGRLLKVAPSGTVLQSQVLPARILARIREHNRKSAAALLGPNAAQTSAVLIGKHLSITGDGQLLLLVNDHDTVVGLLIDPVSYRSRTIQAAPGHRLLSSGGAALLSGDSLYVLFHDAIRAYRVAQ